MSFVRKLGGAVLSHRSSRLSPFQTVPTPLFLNVTQRPLIKFIEVGEDVGREIDDFANKVELMGGDDYPAGVRKVQSILFLLKFRI